MPLRFVLDEHFRGLIDQPGDWDWAELLVARGEAVLQEVEGAGREAVDGGKARGARPSWPCAGVADILQAITWDSRNKG